ncbi:MAG: Catechol 1,2-dioxygenase 1 [uncultured Acidimicrobiales bacterium]|uniref:Catechol 1,2-dioxygenase 1 n=1 Tax=uncultured Acidimicrobiales bacterium TaxID=310071 RepID=A0A6J4IKD8_9ACTN|nr:MAG: Catechol 1,2-dioxygenase 1 [uncultured Acidimicrobiales bacterium]
MTEQPTFSRRNVILAGLGTAVAAVLAACGRSGGGSGTDTAPAAQGAPTTTPATSGGPTTPSAPGVVTTTVLAPTPECADADDLTPAQTEGPYFKPNSPERVNIRGDAGGTKLLLTGTVVTTGCKPVSRALVDFWQADGSGVYDNSGFAFRGHQFTDAQGRYRLEAVMPGLYPGRTPHIHVKVQAPGGRILTTQLYFPGHARNASDGIYRKELEVAMSDAADSRNATFTFVLNG